MSHEGPGKFVSQETAGGPNQEAAPTKENSWKKMQEWIAELKSTSKFSREKTADGREKIRSAEGEEFFIRQIKDPQDPATKKLHKFLLSALSADEVDDLDTIRGAMTGGNYAYHAIEDQSGKMVSVSNVGYLETKLPEQEKATKEAVAFVAYIVTDPNFREKGLGSELYQNIYGFALQEAKSRDHNLKGFIGEAVSTVEPFLNRMGRKRMYFEDRDGNLREVPYMQAPLEWDKKTGRPISRAVPEHLMLRLTSGKQGLSVDELLSMVWALYEDNNIPPDEFFRSEDAAEECYNKVVGYLKNMGKALGESKSGRLSLMSAEERGQKIRELQARGKNVFEHMKRKTKPAVTE